MAARRSGPAVRQKEYHPMGECNRCGVELESFQRPANEETPGSAPTKEGRTMATDPICKMDVDPKTAKWKSSYNGKEYYFCAPGCKKAFDKEPSKYA
jgi:YHS domain-containing protein